MSQRRTRFFRAFLFAILAVLALNQAAFAQGSPFGLIHVAANRSQYTGQGCPIEIIYTATVNFAWPHARGFVFNYHWVRSDGAKTPVQMARPQDNQRSMVIREPWRLGAPGKHYDASVTLFVNSGNTHLAEGSPIVSVTCR